MEKMAFAHQLSAERKSILNGVSKVVQRVSRSSLLPASTSPKFIQAWLLTFIALLPNQGSKYSFFRENSENMPLCLLNICQNTFLFHQVHSTNTYVWRLKENVTLREKVTGSQCTLCRRQRISLQKGASFLRLYFFATEPDREIC